MYIGDIMLVDILGKHPQIKVIDYMLSCPFHEMTKQQLAVGSEISRSTLDRFIEDFLEYGLLCKKGSKYVVNSKSVFIKEFYEINKKLVQIEIETQSNLPEEEFLEYSDKELDEMLNLLKAYQIVFFRCILEKKSNFQKSSDLFPTFSDLV